MKKRLIFCGAMLGICSVLTNGWAFAEEKRLGDYIYVPAMQLSSTAGTTSLRVEGYALGNESDEAQVLPSLSGAEFGVYVISGSGEVRPWANPLYPSEQMRIRTGEGETSFTLPQGAEYYLRQESAPQGYLFDSEALIPVTGDEIVVRNAMAAQIAVTVCDSLGEPIEGVMIEAAGEDGSVTSLITDEAGIALLNTGVEQQYLIRETALPQGVFAAQSAQANGQQTDTTLVAVQTQAASRERVSFVHPAAGAAQLTMMVADIDDNAQPVNLPLEGVHMEIAGAMLEKPIEIVTDDQGQARASLMEGTYDVRFSYDGKEDAVLPLEQGQMIVSSGSTTMIELTASRSTGRIVVQGCSERRIEGGSVTLRSETTGKTYGPYAMDAEGIAVSEPLLAGVYWIDELIVGDGMQAGTASYEGAVAEKAQDLMIRLSAGQAAQVELDLLTREKQTFELLALSLDEQGETVGTQIDQNLALELINERGESIAIINAQSGEVNVEALSGTYQLRMDEKKAGKLGVQPVSGLFDLPSQEETISFAGNLARVRISSVDEHGEPVSGARYLIVDSEGRRSEVVCDEDGMAVSELLAPGEIVIETIAAPLNHDAALVQHVPAMAGETAQLYLEHESYGTMHLTVGLRSLDVFGQESITALPGASVQFYRVTESGMTDTGLTLSCGDDGVIAVQLAPGEYVANAHSQNLMTGMRAPQALRFSVANMQEASAEMLFMDAFGGVRAQLTGGSLTDEQMAQVRFELVAADGTRHEMAMSAGAFYAGGLASGTYVLRQTQIPAGFTLAKERIITVSGGEVTAVDVPLEEYAVLTVSKTGLTFDDELKTYVVPLSGQYGVYTMENGELREYPSADGQVTVWANVTPDQMAQGKAGSVKLPASIEGTTYYLHELSQAQGFGIDETYYELTLRAGESQTLSCAVSSDRGFFSVEQTDAATGELLAGGRYALLDAGTRETVLEFDMTEGVYRNAMAVPVGEYVLRHVQAAPGYALSVQEETSVKIEPYLTQGGMVAQVRTVSTPIPQRAELDVIDDVYAAREQNLTLVTVDTGALGAGEPLLAPTATVSIHAAGTERSNIASLVISGVGDAAGTPYMARVEYCLSGGGWQPSDARTTGVIDGPTAVSLADVLDDVSAVRITYINALTGEEAVGGGFTPGQLTLSVQASAEGELNMVADAVFEGMFAYSTAADEQETVLVRSAHRSIPFVMQADGVFSTVCAGRDGRISGVAFFDQDADGVMDAEETGRYAGLNVSLLDQSGDVIDSCRTGTDGSYMFAPLSSGTYSLRFDAGDAVVFSGGSIFSQHVISGVDAPRYGTTAPMIIDGDHTDYIVHAGCIYASSISGVVQEQISSEDLSGFAGITVELRAKNAPKDEEPFVTVTGGVGGFEFNRILPGRYELRLLLPDGYLCDDTQNGVLVRTLELKAGDSVNLGEFLLARKSSISGRVRVDDDGDGVIDDRAQPLSGVRVVLLGASGSHTGEIAQTTTDENGAYAFENLYMGEYSVLFELSGEWAFTRYGEDSDVYGAVSQSGSTKRFALEPGQQADGVDAGVTIPAQMAVSVFKDTQYDGQKGAYEEMLEGVSISLIRLENGEDAEEITYKTNEEGSVVFAGVSPGEYVIAYQMPGQWRATKQVDPRTTNYHVSCVPQSSVGTGRSEPFILSMGQSGLHMYIGAMLSGSISGVVYYDDNDDAAISANEEVYPDAKVELLNSDDTVIAEMRTGADGSYAFEGLAPGRYHVRFTAEQDCGFSGTERTISRGGVQESDEHIASTRSISVSNGSATESADAGVVRLSAISGVIFVDSDADTALGEREKRLAGVSVSLMNSTARSVIKTVETDAEGRFNLERLRPGTYTLRVDAPDNHVFSGAMAGSPLPLSNERNGYGYSEPFTLLGGANVQNIGFGVLTQGVISGRVWQDDDFDGWMAEGEAGLRSAVIELYDESGALVRETTTIRSGEFEFEEMMPGTYTLSVTLPQGYFFTAEGGDSMAPADVGESISVELGELTMGGVISDVRFGALKPATLGGKVWFDADDDGRRQTDDQHIEGVRAVLEMLSGADQGKIFETTTDAEGVYRFDSVMPGTAKIRFELEDGYAFARNASGTKRVSAVPMTDSLVAETQVIAVSSGEEYGDIDVGVVGVGTVSGSVWEDSEYNGKPDRDEIGVEGARIELINMASGQVVGTAMTGETGAYVIDFVRKGEYVVRVTLPDDKIFTCSGVSAIADIDAGTAQTASFSLDMGESLDGLVFGAIAPAHITGRMIVDENEDGLCGEREAGFSGVTVTVMQGGTVIASTRTAEDGSYAFDMLRPGSYRLRYTLGENALFAKGVALKVSEPDALEGESGEYTLDMGERLSVDSVPVIRGAKISGYAWMDSDVNGLKDAQESAMVGVTAELLDENGHVLAKTQVDESGNYAFVRLRSGAYSVRFMLDPDMLFTDYLGTQEGSGVPVVPGNIGETEQMILAHGQHLDSVNVGGILPGELGDTVWLDENGNGLQDYREPLIPGVTLTLLHVEEDGSMTQTAQTVSDKYGYYSFELLRPGTYALKLEAQKGDTITYHFGDPLGEIDSDLDPDTGISAPFKLSSGQVLLNVDVGLTEHDR